VQGAAAQVVGGLGVAITTSGYGNRNNKHSIALLIWNGEESAMFSSCSSFLCSPLFGFLKLAFAAVLAVIGAAL
jgi:hypothetical protein